MLSWGEYSFYVSDYSGTRDPLIQANDFGYLAKKACRVINQYTFNNIPDGEPEECVKNCVCELAEIYNRYLVQSQIAGLKSESVGDLSYTYSSDGEMQAEQANDIADAVYRNLLCTGYLYAGVT